MTTPARGRAAATALDADLARSVRRTAYMRQGFYVVVLLVALAGQVSGAVETLHMPLAAAIPAVAALELGGIVVLANADVRRRLGESALASRILSVAIAAGAVAFNWLAHANHLLGGFFAGMSALGYLVWLMHTENQRRDRLRATGQLAAVTPAYEVVGPWLAHPWLTRRARALAKADPTLGLYESLTAARAAVRRERREAAIASVLHRKIRAAIKNKDTADIAVHVYDLDEIAARLAATADYAGLTALIAVDLEPSRLAPAAAEVAPQVAPADLPDPDQPHLLIAQLGTPVEVAPDVALPAALPQVIAAAPAAAEVAPPAAIEPAAATAKTTVEPVADRVRALAELVASGDAPTARAVARILGTDNLPHVSRTLREATTTATNGGRTRVTRPGDQRPTPAAPPPRPQRATREETHARHTSRPAGAPPLEASTGEATPADHRAGDPGRAVGGPPRTRRPQQQEPDGPGPDGG
jgi:hypothetical protein